MQFDLGDSICQVDTDLIAIVPGTAEGKKYLRRFSFKGVRCANAFRLGEWLIRATPIEVRIYVSYRMRLARFFELMFEMICKGFIIAPDRAGLRRIKGQKRD